MSKSPKKARIFGAEAVFFAMFAAMAVFSVVMLSGEKDAAEKSMANFGASANVMVEIDNMNIAVLKEAKLAKDVWVRGSDPEERKKYRGEFVEQVGVFEKNYAAAMGGLKSLAMGNSEYDVFISKLTPVAAEHQAMNNKYLAQIDMHAGNAAESDAKVAGIDRALSDQLTGVRDNFVQFLEAKGAKNIVEGQQDFNQRRNIILAWVLISFGLSMWLLH